MSAGPVIWVYGLPASGKSTLARHLGARLKDAGVCHVLLDGDALRGCLVPPPGYGESARLAFYRTLANLAAEIAGQGLVAIVAATSHRRTFRDYARNVAPRFIEVWVDTPLPECIRRDPRGLYRRAREGELRDVPGADLPFEAPLTTELTVDGTSERASREILATLVALCREREPGLARKERP